jgi:hypothetical protein
MVRGGKREGRERGARDRGASTRAVVSPNGLQQSKSASYELASGGAGSTTPSSAESRRGLAMCRRWWVPSSSSDKNGLPAKTIPQVVQIRTWEHSALCWVQACQHGPDVRAGVWLRSGARDTHRHRVRVRLHQGDIGPHVLRTPVLLRMARAKKTVSNVNFR